MPMRRILGIAAAILIAASAFAENTDENNPRRIAIWGSSGQPSWNQAAAAKLASTVESVELDTFEMCKQVYPAS